MQRRHFLHKCIFIKGRNCARNCILINVVIGLFLTGCNITNTHVVMSKKPTSFIINKNIYADKKAPSQILLNNKISVLNGWNHVNAYPDEFNALSFSKELYQTNNVKLKNNTNSHYSTILIKKIDDWHHQHANGVTAQFPSIKFDNVAGLELVLKVNSETSHIPNDKQLIQTYNQWLNEQSLKKLDNENVHLSFAIVGHESEINEGVFNADFLLSLNVKKQLDQWLYIFIPNRELRTYKELNYKKIPLTGSKAKSESVSSFRLMAETKSTQVVRNLIPDNFDEHIPQLLKEVGVEFKYIGIVKNSQDKTDSVKLN